MSGERTSLQSVVGPVERLVYRSLRLRPDREQSWKAYARSLLVFSLASVVLLYVLQRVQGLLPLMTATVIVAEQAGNPIVARAGTGLTGSTPFYNLTGSLAMVAGRFLPILAVLAIAGSLAAKERVSAGPGTFPTHTPLFVGLLVGVILIVGALTFFPVLAVGPLVEQLLQGTGQLF